MAYEWSDTNLITTNLNVECGAIVVEIFNDDGTDFDPDFFSLHQTGQTTGAFTVKRINDLQAIGTYSFRFRAHFSDAPDLVFELDQPFFLDIRDECSLPDSLKPPQPLISGDHMV